MICPHISIRRKICRECRSLCHISDTDHHRGNIAAQQPPKRRPRRAARADQHGFFSCERNLPLRKAREETDDIRIVPDHPTVRDHIGIHRTNAPRVLAQIIQQGNDLRLERDRYIESRDPRITQTIYSGRQGIRTDGQSRIHIVKPCIVQGCILYDR